MQDDHGIGGAHNRVAGRDYYENPTIIEAPRPSRRPGLVACPACEREGLSPAAIICPDCGHDLTLERRLRQRNRELFRGACMATITAATITGANLYVETDRLIGDAIYYLIGTLWLAVLLMWLRCWLLARA